MGKRLFEEIRNELTAKENELFGIRINDDYSIDLYCKDGKSFRMKFLNGKPECSKIEYDEQKTKIDCKISNKQLSFFAKYFDPVIINADGTFDVKKCKEFVSRINNRELQIRDVEDITSSDEYKKMLLAIELFEKSKNPKTKEKWNNLFKNYDKVLRKWNSKDNEFLKSNDAEIETTINSLSKEERILFHNILKYDKDFTLYSDKDVSCKELKKDFTNVIDIDAKAFKEKSVTMGRYLHFRTCCDVAMSDVVNNSEDFYDVESKIKNAYNKFLLYNYLAIRDYTTWKNRNILLEVFENNKDANNNMSLDEKKEKMKEAYEQTIKSIDEKNYGKISNLNGISIKTLGHLYEIEKDTKLFSSAKDYKKEYGTKLEIWNNIARKMADKEHVLGFVSSYMKMDSPMKIMLFNQEAIDKKDEIDIYGSFDGNGVIGTLNHELEHYKMRKIAEAIINRDVEKYGNQINGTICLIERKLKDYIKKESVKRYNNAANLLGLKTATKSKAYDKYELIDDKEEMLLLGNSIYGKTEAGEFVAEVPGTTGFQKEILNDLYKKVLNNDFENLTNEEAINFAKEIGFKDERDIYNQIDNLEVVKDKLVLAFGNKVNSPKYFIDGMSVSETFLDNIYDGVSDYNEAIRRFIKYKTLLEALKATANFEGNEDKREIFVKSLEKQIAGIKWSNFKDNNICNEQELEELKKYIESFKKHYSNKVKALDSKSFELAINKLKDDILSGKTIKQLTLERTFNQYNAKNSFVRSNYENMLKSPRYILMKKFTKSSPHFKNLLDQLNNLSKISQSDEEVALKAKEILTRELKDVYDAYLFFEGLGVKDLGNNPIKDIKNKKFNNTSLVVENQKYFDNIINSVSITKDKILKANSVFAEKSFSELIKNLNKREEENEKNINDDVVFVKKINMGYDKGKINKDIKKPESENTNEQEIKVGKPLNASTKKKIKLTILDDLSADKKDGVIANNQNIGVGNKQKKTKMDLLGILSKGKENGTDHEINESKNSYFDARNIDAYINENEKYELLKIKTLLDKSMNLDIPIGANKNDILILNGPLKIVGRSEPIGYPNIIMKGPGDTAYYLSWQGVIFKETKWRKLEGQSYEKLFTALEGQTGREFVTDEERMLNKGRFVGGEGACVLRLKGNNKIREFKNNIDDIIQVTREKLLDDMYCSNKKRAQNAKQKYNKLVTIERELNGITVKGLINDIRNLENSVIENYKQYLDGNVNIRKEIMMDLAKNRKSNEEIIIIKVKNNKNNEKVSVMEVGKSRRKNVNG